MGCLWSNEEENENNLQIGTQTIYKLIFETFEEEEKRSPPSFIEVLK